ncbi:MAG: Glu-tRNA(Gln) amidotransferase subunit GatE, partial [Candidatus Altarchaeaceae archaeon]
EDENTITYRLDRLGIPLIEIATYPDIKSPEHARETAEKIGTILRTLKVKRGIGTIRQDINVSIKGGARVEIKGCQELNLIPKILRYEIERQKMLINLKNLSLCKEEDIKEDFVNLEEIFKETKCKIISQALKNNGVVYGLKLKNFAGHIGSKFCSIENVPRFGKELAGYLKANTKLKGLFHSDELPNYGISEEEVKKTFEILKCDKNDAFVILAGEKDEVMKGLKVIVERVKIALKYVPEETRRATENGETEYMRPLPGAARMYPETDIPIIYIDEKYLENLKKELPETIDEKFKRYENLVGKELANQLIHSKYNKIFDEFVGKFKIKPSIIANTILSVQSEIKKKYNFNFEISENLSLIEEIFNFLEKGIISNLLIPEILYYAKKENKSVEKIIEEKNFSKKF